MTIINPLEKAVARATSGKCDGQCGDHIGAVRVFDVSFGSFEYGYFSYCEAAVDEDRGHGLKCIAVDGEEAGK